MITQVPFIGREEVFERICGLIESWGSQQMVCIEAPGGIGKTRLLEEISQKYISCHEPKKPLLAVDVIDFDDQSFLSPKQTGRKIAQMLGGDKFSPYFEVQKEYRQMVNAGISLDELEQVRKNVQSNFIECFNEISKNSRVLLSFDTTDHLEKGRGMWREFEVISHLKNLCVLLTGRNAHEIADYLKNYDITHVHTINLTPLNEEESIRYLDYKQKLKLTPIPSDMKSKLVVLSAGRPILLDLAIEWLFRKISLEWLHRVSLSELKKEDRRQEFEELLLQNVTQLRDPMDRLTLIMSHVYPLNVDMVDHFIESAEAHDLVEKAKSYVFIKQLPGGYISLHDEVRRMINVYVLPATQYDTLQELKNYSNLAVNYFAQKIEEFDAQLEKTKDFNIQETDIYMERADILRRRHSLMAQQVDHAFFSDIEAGVKTYSKVIWKLRREHRTRVALHIQESVDKYLAKLTKDSQRREYELLRARLLNDSGNALEAEIALKELLQEKQITIDEKAGIYNALAVSELMLGKLNSALEHQLECLDIVTKSEDTASIPQVANYTGYIYERLGDLKKAIEYYHRALNATLLVTNPGHNIMANILDNLSHAYCQDGLFSEAQNYIENALTIWTKMNEETQIARGEITQGVIYRDQGEYDKAIDYLRRAIDRLKEPDDHQKLIKAFFHLGWALWFKGVSEIEAGNKDYNKTLKSARQAFEHSLELAEKYHWRIELPGILHQTSNVYQLLGEKDKARETNNRAYELSKEVHDIRYAVDSLVGKAEFDYENGQYDRITEYSKILTEEYEQKNYEFPRFYGRMRRIQADIAFENEDYNTALKYYTKGLAQIRLHGGYGVYLIKRELAALQKRLELLPADTAIDWSIYMRQEWAKQQPTDKYLSMLSWCDQQVVNSKLRALI